jgi:SRSO17 transposase
MEIRAPPNEAIMDPLESNASRLRFEAYIEQLASVIGHADRMVPLHDYCTGLLLPGERKSVEPMAALTAASFACSLVHLRVGGQRSRVAA